MRVVMYYNNSDIRLEEMPKPEIGPDELLVKVLASGICGSDVMEWYRIKKAPLVLGHEVAGDVVEVGRNVAGFNKGDRVVVSHHVPCNSCHYCLTGNHTCCETLHTTNFYPGGFAEYLRVPPINVDRGTFLLPDEVSYEEGAFVEPLACVVRSQREAGFKAGDCIAVLGSGISGLLHIMLAKASGSGRIIATDIDPYRLEKAAELGAEAVIDAREEVPLRVREANGGRPADLVIVCAGTLTAFQQALGCVDRGGTILCFATTEPGVALSVPLNDFWRNGITMLPSYANSPYDAKVALELIRTKRVPVKQLITHRLGLHETGKGFQLVARAASSIKVIVEPQR